MIKPDPIWDNDRYPGEMQGASELKGIVMPEIGGWMSDAGNICNEEGYGIVIILPQGGYMTVPPEMGRRILKALSSA